MAIHQIAIDHGLGNMLNVPIVTILIKDRVRVQFRQIFPSIKPFLPIFKLTVIDGGVPIYICSQDNMWQIIPFLVAFLVAVGIFRKSGAFEYLLDGVRWTVSLFTDRTEFVDALPVGLMKPLSGGLARGLMMDISKTFGVDSFAGNLASVFRGCAETTFYVLALYFGSVNIRKSRYAVTGGLIADLFGILGAIFAAYLFFY